MLRYWAGAERLPSSELVQLPSVRKYLGSMQQYGTTLRLYVAVRIDIVCLQDLSRPLPLLFPMWI